MASSRIKMRNPMRPITLYARQVVKEILLGKESVLYEEQQQALLNIINWFEEHPDKICLVVMPTGTGKTGIISCLPYMFGWGVAKGKIRYNLSNPILLIAPGLSLLSQLKQDVAYDPENPNPFLLRRGVFRKDEKEYLYETYVVETSNAVQNLATLKGKTDVVISNVQKWRRGKDDIPNYQDLPDDFFSAVVVDEAHHLPAPQWQKIINKFKRKAKIIFFTATPDRHDGQRITVDRPLTSPSDFAYILKRDVAIEKKLIRDVTFKNLGSLTDTEVLEIIRYRLEEKNAECPLPGGIKHAAIVITRDQNHAESVESTCLNHLEWTEVKAIHSKLSKGDQKLVLDNIKANKYELIIVVGMLLEGFDHPPLSVAGILAPIKSKVKFAQFVGRIQRLVRNPHREKGIVGDILSSRKYHQDDMFQQYIEPTITEFLEEDDETYYA